MRMLHCGAGRAQQALDAAGLQRHARCKHHSVMKTPRWGYWSGKPRESLSVPREAQVVAAPPAQGPTFSKGPRAKVASGPTTLQRTDSPADQITREGVGVSVSGLAVIRIAEPM